MDDGMLKKINFIFLIVLFIFTGCEATSQNQFTVQIFYTQTCPACVVLRNTFIPAIEKEFGQQVEIIEYDMDNEESKKMYFSYTGQYDWQNQEWIIESQLIGMPRDHLCNHEKTSCNLVRLPFVVVDEKYAFFGYDVDLLEEYMTDIHLGINNEPLLDGETKKGRFDIYNEKNN